MIDMNHVCLPYKVMVCNSLRNEIAYLAKRLKNSSIKEQVLWVVYPKWHLDRKNDELLKIDIVCRLPWKYQRQIWIAYYKNRNNKKCIIGHCPKSILYIIVDLCANCVFNA